MMSLYGPSHKNIFDLSATVWPQNIIRNILMATIYLLVLQQSDGEQTRDELGLGGFETTVQQHDRNAGAVG